MKKQYLGDSYDIVKRFWAILFRPIAPLYAHARFVPEAIRPSYETITSIPVIERPLNKSFGILLDPHTGIPLPGDKKRRATISHVPLEYIVQLIQDWKPRYAVIFDQSYYRKHEINREHQLATKMRFLALKKIQSFYYVSHAPSLICSNIDDTLQQIYDSMIKIGIPRSRLKKAATSRRTPKF